MPLSINQGESTPEGGNIKYIDWEVPTWKNSFDPVPEKVLEKDVPVLKNQGTKSLFLTTRRAFRINLTCSGKL